MHRVYWEFQKRVWTEKEKLWTWTKKNWSPKEKARYKASLRPVKKSTYESYSPCVKIKQAFLCCYECSDFFLAGQLSGLGCGEFLLILAFLWPQWTVSTARETIPFKFHKADLARLPASVQGAGDPQSSQEGLCQPAVQKQLQKDHSQKPHTSLKPARIPKPLAYGSPGLFLLSYLTSFRQKQKTTVWLSKTIYRREYLWWRGIALEKSLNFCLRRS